MALRATRRVGYIPVVGESGFNKTSAMADRQRGMSLVEVLVTLVSTSVGLLGIAALQLVSMRSNQDAFARVQAASLAGSMLDRIRINRSGFDGHEYDHIAFNATGMAQKRSGADLGEWQAEIDRALPGDTSVAAGAIERSPGTDIVTVTVRWSAQAGNTETARVSTLVVRTEI